MSDIRDISTERVSAHDLSKGGKKVQITTFETPSHEPWVPGKGKNMLRKNSLRRRTPNQVEQKETEANPEKSATQKSKENVESIALHRTDGNITRFIINDGL